MAQNAYALAIYIAIKPLKFLSFFPFSFAALEVDKNESLAEALYLVCHVLIFSAMGIYMHIFILKKHMHL